MNVHEIGMGEILIVSHKSFCCLIDFHECSPKWVPWMILFRIFNTMWRESFFCRGSLFSAWLCRLLGVMTRFLQTTNDSSGRRKWTPGHFSTLKNDRGSIFEGGRYSSLHRHIHMYMWYDWNIGDCDLKQKLKPMDLHSRWKYLHYSERSLCEKLLPWEEVLLFLFL